jgi:hypothetical protein
MENKLKEQYAALRKVIMKALTDEGINKYELKNLFEAQKLLLESIIICKHVESLGCAHGCSGDCGSHKE